MRHFPIFLELRNRRVIVAGAGETAVAKLRLLLKSEASIEVYGRDADPEVLDFWWPMKTKIESHCFHPGCIPLKVLVKQQQGNFDSCLHVL